LNKTPLPEKGPEMPETGMPGPDSAVTGQIHDKLIAMYGRTPYGKYEATHVHYFIAKA
jgi:hypothetical protein